MSIAKNPAKLITILILFLLTPFTMGAATSLSYAQSGGIMGNEVTVSGVMLLEDHLTELQKKLGSPACIVTDADHARTVYIYRGSDRSFFSFSIRTSQAHVDHDRVNAIGMSNLVNLPQECQRSIPASSAVIPIRPSSQNGIQLGTSLNQVIGTYGQPKEIRTQGSLIRIIYSRPQGYNHHLVWTFNFDNEHLTDWTVEAFPVFYELGG